MSKTSYTYQNNVRIYPKIDAKSCVRNVCVFDFIEHDQQ